jgi:penicillin-binding protein 1A
MYVGIMIMIKTIFQKKWVKWVLYAIAGFIFFSICFYTSIYFGFWGKLPNKEELSSLKQAEATQVLDKDGHMIGKYYIYDRQPISYEDLPQHLIDALVATEDVRFYEHDGVDNTSLLRVFFKTILLRDKSSGGGSTITLQFAKNLF